jgi:hypothetical protein
MKSTLHRARRDLLATVLCAILSAAPLVVLAQAPAPAAGFVPSVGQEGKDVIWVPTPPELVERMLKLAQVTNKDYVVDLGAGDGRIAIAAARSFGARALGIEYNPEMVVLSNQNAQQAGVAAKATFIQGDIFEKDFSDATVVTMYLLTALNMRLRPKLLEMKPGTRLVAHQFGMGDWMPDETSYAEGRPAHLWIVPAKAGGSWKLRIPAGANTREFTVQVDQTFQKFTGSANFGKVNTTLRDTRLQGDAIRFTLTDLNGKLREFSGRIRGDTMSGEIRGPGGERLRWQAARAG